MKNGNLLLVKTLLSLLTLTIPAFAQTFGEMTGTVVDTSNAIVPVWSKNP